MLQYCSTECQSIMVHSTCSIALLGVIQAMQKVHFHFFLHCIMHSTTQYCIVGVLQCYIIKCNPGQVRSAFSFILALQKVLHSVAQIFTVLHCTACNECILSAYHKVLQSVAQLCTVLHCTECNLCEVRIAFHGDLLYHPALLSALAAGI